MNRALAIAIVTMMFLATFVFLSLPQKAEASESMIVGVTYANTASAFLNRDAALMHEAGINMVRLMFNPYGLSNSLPSLVPAIVNAKIAVLGVLYNEELLSANNINGWSDYVYKTVSTYKNYVKVWEVWNEPDWNTGFAPDGQVGSVVKYVQWLKAAYPKIKQADPTCRVIGGSISVCQANTLTWLSNMYDNGARTYMDVLSVHPYDNDSPLPPATSSGGKAFWRAQDARNIMIQKGDSNKFVWFTELGWRTSGSGVVVTEALQAQYIKDALTYAKTNWSWLETFIIYQWQDGGGDCFGLLRSDGSRKPSFYAVKTFTQNAYALTYALTVNVVGSGSVSRNPSQALYPSGTVVTLTASPAAGYVFSGWSGALTGNANSATITMNGDKTVTATFATPSSEIIVDNAAFVGSWPSSSAIAGYYGVGYRYHVAGTGANTAIWSFNIPTSGSWQVYARWTSYPNRATNAKYTVNSASGSYIVTVNQETNGGTWQSLGTYSFNVGAYSVRLTDNANEIVIADAIRLVRAVG